MATTKKKSGKTSSVKKKSTFKKKKKVFSGNFTLKPSQIFDTPWIYAERKRGKYPNITDNSGKWLIYVWDYNIDLVWEKIKLATEKGMLGPTSKVSTMMPSPLAPKPNLKVICVYSYDYTDKEDVMRIREELRKIGVTSKISYKTDDVTRSAQYSFNKKGRVSLYYE